MVEITIITLEDRVCSLKMGDELARAFFSCLKKDTPDSYRSLQIADTDFKDKLPLLHEFTETYPCIHQFVSYLKKIKVDSYFAVMNGKITDSLLISQIKSELEKLSGVPQRVDISLFEPILSKYNMREYGAVRVNIGEPNKEKRICRFCGKSFPEVHFDTKSHAISEMLGNKNVICLEECDDCNKYFAQTIEQDLYSIVSFFISLYRIKGKDGERKTKGKNFSLYHDENNTLVFQLGKGIEIPRNLDELRNFDFVFDNTNNTYIPQNVYKCLCKFVLSVIANNELIHYKKTIQWICGKLERKKIPLITFSELPYVAKNPKLLVFQRKLNDAQFPYIFASLLCINMHFIFILPFSSIDSVNFSFKKNYMSFFDNLRIWFPNLTYSLSNFSSTEKDSMPIKIDFKIPEGN